MRLSTKIQRLFKANPGRNRMFILAVLLLVTSASIVGVNSYFLYLDRLKAEHLRMQSIVKSQARLIETVAAYIGERVRKYPANHPLGEKAETISQIRHAQEEFGGFGLSGEFTLAQRDSNQIHFFIQGSKEYGTYPEMIPFESELAQPMRLALLGKSGSVIGFDYKGNTVLAAYEPLTMLEMGLVAKLDLAEIRKNFLSAAALSWGIALILVSLAIVIFFRLGNPLLEQLQSSVLHLNDEIVRRESAEQKLRDYSIELEKQVLQRTQELGAKVDEANRMNLGIINMAEDLRNVNETLEKSNKHVFEKNKELETFSYSVSHDLRAPLRSINGFAKILVEEHRDQLDAEGQRLLKVVTDAADKMGKLIDGILAFSRLGRTNLKLQTFDLGLLIEEIIQELEPMTSGRKVEWKVAKLPRITADRVLMHQVFQNLLTNALKYSSTRDIATVEIGSDVQADDEIIFVRDNGVGFDMKFVDKIFLVFQRLHREDEFKGEGIGLAFVKRILERHGGRIWAQSELDLGTTMYVSLINKVRV